MKYTLSLLTVLSFLITPPSYADSKVDHMLIGATIAKVISNQLEQNKHTQAHVHAQPQPQPQTQTQFITQPVYVAAPQPVTVNKLLTNTQISGGRVYCVYGTTTVLSINNSCVTMISVTQ